MTLGKRLFDLVIALVLAVILLPIGLIMAVGQVLGGWLGSSAG